AMGMGLKLNPLNLAFFCLFLYCQKKMWGGIWVRAQPFRLSPPETVDAMNAILMSCWEGLNLRQACLFIVQCSVQQKGPVRH
ncbi:hypothetical protein, partial [Sphingopyxis sp.]|uniref:hypothetical protein n=1 Tax=Sphingopyxis sp. TaxID=1908224 RepID=UPI001DE33A65